MNIIEVVNSLEDVIITGGATEEDVIHLEKELGLSFSNEYKEFLIKFGSVLADDVEIVGFSKSKNRNVLEVTREERGMNNGVPSDLYVVENTGIEGIIIWQDESGAIYQSSPNKKIEKISSSLAEYISSK
ncbi:SMI1-KNR4 cell-wall [Lachnospiraceae bacterium A10]|nr:SMI1-KNR4 cell-wall [Lachnospiraceae bacterium A10]